MGSRSRRWTRFFGWTATLVALLAVLEFLRPPRSVLAWEVAFNVGHAPLFGLISLVFLQLVELVPSWSANHRPRAYALALLLTVLLGTGDEVHQVFGARDSDFIDLVRDAIGAASFLIFTATFDRDVLREYLSFNRRRALVRGGAAALLTVAFAPAFTTARLYASRGDAFPQLCGFEASWELSFVEVRAAKLTVLPHPAPDDRDSKNRVGRITFASGGDSSFSISEPFPDWTGYQTLRFEVFSELDRTVKLLLRIRDYESQNRRGDRFSRWISIRPGENLISVALADVRTAPEEREFDMSSIRYLLLIARDSKRQFSLFFDAFRLEK